MNARAVTPEELLRAEIDTAPAHRLVCLEIPRVSAEVAWEMFSDTELLNRALGSPEFDVCNIPVRPGFAKRLMTTRTAPKITYEEEHYQWERGFWLGGRRFFLDGPLERFVFCFSQHPIPEGAVCDMRFGFWSRDGDAAANAMADGLARGLQALQPSLRTAHRMARPRVFIHGPGEGQLNRVQLRVMGAALRDSGEAPQTVASLLEHVEQASDQELTHMEPLALAAQWGQPPDRVVDAFIRAARLGMLIPQWSVACPSCRGPKGTTQDVAQLAREPVHCEDCNISFNANPTENMALTFTPAAEVRRVEVTFVCVAGPTRTPHIVAQAYVPPRTTLRLARGATVREGLWLSSPMTGGAVRLSGTARFAIGERETLERRDELDVLEVVNETDERLRARIEDRELPDTFLRASTVLQSPRFRELFGADQWEFLSAMSRAWEAEFGRALKVSTSDDAAHTFDLVVVGAGPGGEAAALRAAHLGRKVALVEASPRFGGPTGLGSKAMREAVRQIMSWSENASQSAKRLDPARRFARVRTLFEQRFGTLRRYVASLQMQDVLQRLTRAGVSLHHARASFSKDGTLELHPTTGEPPYALRGTHYVLATGSRPARPKEIPFDTTRVLDAEGMSELEQLPRTLTIVGAGVIGCEFATIMAALGVKVTLITGGRQPFPFLDGELARAGVEQMARGGIQFVNDSMAKVERLGECVTVQLQSGEVLTSDVMLFAEGRQGNSDGLGCENVGICVGRYGRVEVDEEHRTSNASVYAIGDLAGPPGLASAATEQGKAVADRILRPERPAKAREVLTPTTIWTFPELAGAGLTEDDAHKRGLNVVTGRALYRDLPRGILSGDLHGWLKLVADADDGRLLGVHIIGEEACELVHYGAALIEAGAHVEELTRSGFSAITFHGLYQAAAEDALDALTARVQPPQPHA